MVCTKLCLKLALFPWFGRILVFIDWCAECSIFTEWRVFGTNL